MYNALFQVPLIPGNLWKQLQECSLLLSALLMPQLGFEQLVQGLLRARQGTCLGTSCQFDVSEELPALCTDDATPDFLDFCLQVLMT